MENITVSGKTYKCLTQRSVEDCTNEMEEDAHHLAVEMILSEIKQQNESKHLIIVIERVDKYGIGGTRRYLATSEDLEEIVSRLDIKNGVDFFLNDEKDFCVLLYGQGYTVNDQRHYLVQHLLLIRNMEGKVEEEFLSIEDGNKEWHKAKKIIICEGKKYLS